MPRSNFSKPAGRVGCALARFPVQDTVERFRKTVVGYRLEKRGYPRYYRPRWKIGGTTKSPLSQRASPCRTKITCGVFRQHEVNLR